MKQSIFIIFMIAFCAVATAQNQDTQEGEGKNVIKVNLSALAVKNFSFQVERQVSRKVSVALGGHTLPYGTLPYVQILKNQVSTANVNFDLLKLGTWGFTPEVRFYTGKKGALHGFYIGAMVNQARYKVALPIEYGTGPKTGIFNGNLNTLTGGIQIGAQWKLSKHLILDWWIIGPNYGGGNGVLDFTGQLSDMEQASIQNEINKLNNDLPVKVIKSSSTSSSGAHIELQGPWAGIRSGAICLGYRF